MKTADSHSPKGPGILPLQHHGFADGGLKPHERTCLLAFRIVGREEDKGQLGHYREDPETRGDLLGAFHWRRSTRDTSGWAFAWPVMTYTGSTRAGAAEATPEPIVDETSGSGGAAAVTPGVRADGALVTADGQIDWQRYVHLAMTGHYDAATRNYIFQAAAVAAGKVVAGKVETGKKDGGGSKTKTVLLPVLQVGVGANTNLGVFGLGVQPFGVNLFAGGGGAFGIGVQALNLNPFFGNVNLGGGFPAFGFGPAAQAVFVLPKDDEYYSPNPSGFTDDGSGKKGGGKGPQGAPGEKGQFGDNQPWMSGDLTEASLPTTILPVGRSWLGDTRFGLLQTDKPIWWPDFPRGFYGIGLTATVENEQREQFHPTDPRIPCPNVAGPSRVGAILADMSPLGELDPERHARIQSILRVVKQPTGTKGPLRGNAKRETPGNWLARQLGPSGQGDCYGGLVMDLPTGIGSVAAKSRILAHESVLLGGPLDVGHYGDAHQIGVDADGNPINSLHISTGALFKVRGNPLLDGPLHFEAEYPQTTELPIPLKVHLSYDLKLAKWRWWSTTLFEYPPGTPTTTTPPPTGTPPPTTTTPGGGEITPPAEPLNPDGTRIGGGTSLSSAPRFGAGTPNEIMAPAMSFRPQRIQDGEPDLRFDHAVSMGDRARYNREAPTTIRMESFGAQGGDPSAPYLAQRSDWRYTQEPGRSRAPAGTAAGGIVFLPPEVDLSDVDDDFAPEGLDLSASLVVVGPRTRFGAGSPELAGGGLRTGYTWGVDPATGDLVFWRHDAAGVATEAFRFRADGSRELNDHGSLFLFDALMPWGPMPPAYAPTPAFAGTGPRRNMTYVGGNQQIRVDRPGVYNVEMHASLESVAPPMGFTFGFHVLQNGAATPIGGHVSVMGPGEVRNISATGSLQCAVGDVLQVGSMSNPAGAQINLVDLGLKAVRIE